MYMQHYVCVSKSLPSCLKAQEHFEIKSVLGGEMISLPW